MPLFLDMVQQWKSAAEPLQACVSQVRTAVTPEVLAVHPNNL
jgi:hypothetical protein